MDRLTPEQRSENMRRIRSKGSSPEMAVRRMAHAMGFRFRLHNERLPGRPDLVFPRLRKIIFVHGCFWHSHRRCGVVHSPKSRQEYWVPKLARTQKRDVLNEETLRAVGWDVLTVWECATREPEELRRLLGSFLHSGGAGAVIP